MLKSDLELSLVLAGHQKQELSIQVPALIVELMRLLQEKRMSGLQWLGIK